MTNVTGTGRTLVGGFIDFSPAPELLVYAVFDFARTVQSWVFGPHPGVHLADGTNDVRYCARLDGPAAGGDLTVTISLAEDLENWDKIVKGFEEGVDAFLQIELLPEFPMGILFVGVFCSNAGSDRFLDKAEVRAENIGSRRLHSCRGSFCGKFRSK